MVCSVPFFPDLYVTASENNQGVNKGVLLSLKSGCIYQQLLPRVIFFFVFCFILNFQPSKF